MAMTPSEIVRAINAGILCHPKKSIAMRLNMARILNSPKQPYNRRSGTRSSTSRYKMYWHPHGAHIPKPNRSNHTLHMDFKEKLLETGVNLEKHMLTITDTFDKSIAAYPTIDTRGKTCAKIIARHLNLQRLQGLGECVHVRFDNAQTFQSDVVQSLMSERNIFVSWTPKYDHHEVQNRAESSHRIIDGIRRQLMATYKFPIELWPYLVRQASYLHSFRPNRGNPQNMSPMQRRHGEIPDLSKILLNYSVAYYPSKRQSNDPKNKWKFGRLLCPAADGRSVWVMNADDQKPVKSHDVKLLQGRDINSYSPIPVNNAELQEELQTKGVSEFYNSDVFPISNETEDVRVSDHNNEMDSMQKEDAQINNVNTNIDVANTETNDMQREDTRATNVNNDIDSDDTETVHIHDEYEKEDLQNHGIHASNVNEDIGNTCTEMDDIQKVDVRAGNVHEEVEHKKENDAILDDQSRCQSTAPTNLHDIMERVESKMDQMKPKKGKLRNKIRNIKNRRLPQKTRYNLRIRTLKKQLRRSNRISRPPKFISMLANVNVPDNKKWSRKEAMKAGRKDIMAAFAKEDRAWERNSVVKEISRKDMIHSHITPIGEEAFLKRIDKSGNVKAKARRWLRGDKMIAGIHYDATKGSCYAPTIRPESTRILMALATHLRNTGRMVMVRHADQTTAYLSCKRSNDEPHIYMKQYPGYIWKDHTIPEDERILQCTASIYGSKTAGKEYYTKISGNFIQIGFSFTNLDKCLFIREEGEGIVHTLCALHGDDMLIVCANMQIYEKILTDLQALGNDLVDMGDTSYHLGVEILQTEENGVHHIELRQDKYIEELCDKYLTDKERNSPLDLPIDPSVPTNEYFRDIPSWCIYTKQELTKARQMVGAIMSLYLNTQPHIGYVITSLAQHTEYVPLKVIKHCKDILRFLMKHKMGIKYGCSSDNIISAYVDAGYGTCNKGKSRSGGMIFLNGGPILYYSRKQSTCALSPMCAEYIAISEMLKDIIWIRHELENLGYKQLEPTTLWDDNTEAVDMTINPHRKFRKCKYLLPKYFHIMENIDESINLRYMRSKHNLADGLTKQLRTQQLMEHVRRICAHSRKYDESLFVLPLPKYQG